MTEIEAARQFAELIASFRKEVADQIRESVEREVSEVESSGFDPARGRGRGPRWFDGE
jgi:hypothetical protein